jgi:DNA invertase Pin-like site-specific DNA recombinase
MTEPDPGAPALIEAAGCPTCAAPAGSPCRSASGNTAFRYHTARLLLVPGLVEPEVPVPADRGPGRPWQGPSAEEAVRDRRVGYVCGVGVVGARDQLDALRAHGCDVLFADHVEARAAPRPERDRALAAAGEAARTAAAGQGRGRAAMAVLAVGDLARSSADLADVVQGLAEADVRLEILTGPLAGLHDPREAGRHQDSAPGLFAVLAAARALDQASARERNAAGRQAADARGRRSGRPRVFDDALLAEALAHRDGGVPVPEIARRLVIATGKNAGGHPSPASVYRALAAHDTQAMAGSPALVPAAKETGA